jgi:hypothetical protein
MKRRGEKRRFIWVKKHQLISPAQAGSADSATGILRQQQYASAATAPTAAVATASAAVIIQKRAATAASQVAAITS